MASPFSDQIHLSPNLKAWYKTICPRRQEAFKEAMLSIEDQPLPDGKTRVEMRDHRGEPGWVAFSDNKQVITYQNQADNGFYIGNAWPAR